ncbi:hypothetical protein [Streptomyces sp. NPDC058671]|uniref:hypothetical protein n=1 Tax=unclassified Streptomyces TaxID=2593676 RepID=UPI0036607909
MPLLPLYEVDVPIRNTAGLRGVHVFTATPTAAALPYGSPTRSTTGPPPRGGRARGPLQAAGRLDGWTGRGYRLGWELGGRATAAGRWNEPYSWARADDGDIEQ